MIASAPLLRLTFKLFKRSSTYKKVIQDETLESVLTCVAVTKGQQAPVHLDLVVHGHPSTDSPVVDVAAKVAGRAA
jgi:hypothetical protein